MSGRSGDGWKQEAARGGPTCGERVGASAVPEREYRVHNELAVPCRMSRDVLPKIPRESLITDSSTNGSVTTCHADSLLKDLGR